MTDSLFATVMSWIATSVGGAINFFTSFFTGKFLTFFLAMFIIYLVGRSLLIPIIGGRAIPRAGSDSVDPKISASANKPGYTNPYAEQQFRSEIGSVYNRYWKG